MKILIVDDMPAMLDSLVRLLGLKGHEVVTATTLDEARAVFSAQKEELELIVVDGSLDPNATKLVADTAPLVREIRDSGYTRPIVAHSSNQRLLDELGQAGCDMKCHKAGMERLDQLIERALCKPAT